MGIWLKRCRKGVTVRTQKHAEDLESVVDVTMHVDDNETRQGRLGWMVTVLNIRNGRRFWSSVVLLEVVVATLRSRGRACPQVSRLYIYYFGITSSTSTSFQVAVLEATSAYLNDPGCCDDAGVVRVLARVLL